MKQFVLHHFDQRHFVHITYPVWDEVVETQAVGVCVILSAVPVVVDLRELERYTKKILKWLSLEEFLR